MLDTSKITNKICRGLGVNTPEDEAIAQTMMILLGEAYLDQQNDEEVNSKMMDFVKMTFKKEVDYLDKLYRFNVSIPESDYTKEELDAIWERKNLYESYLLAIEEHT